MTWATEQRWIPQKPHTGPYPALSQVAWCRTLAVCRSGRRLLPDNRSAADNRHLHRGHLPRPRRSHRSSRRQAGPPALTPGAHPLMRSRVTLVFAVAAVVLGGVLLVPAAYARLASDDSGGGGGGSALERRRARTTPPPPPTLAAGPVSVSFKGEFFSWALLDRQDGQDLRVAEHDRDQLHRVDDQGVDRLRLPATARRQGAARSDEGGGSTRDHRQQRRRGQQGPRRCGRLLQGRVEQRPTR